MIFKAVPSDFNSHVEVVSCLCEYQDKILLLKRHFLKSQGDTWGPPAGKVKEGESLIQAIIRETREETGIQFQENNLFYLGKLYLRYPEYDFVFHTYRGVLTAEPQVQVKQDEHTSYTWISPKEAVKMTLIKDEDTVIKFYYNF